MSTIDKKKFQFVERDDFASETIDAPSYSYWKSVFRQFFKKKSTIFMLAVLVGILLMSFVYPMFSNFDYNDVSKVNDFTARLNPPSAKAFFGTDNNGKSLFDGVWFPQFDYHLFYCYLDQRCDWCSDWWDLGCVKINRPLHDGSL